MKGECGDYFVGQAASDVLRDDRVRRKAIQRLRLHRQLNGSNLVGSSDFSEVLHTALTDPF